MITLTLTDDEAIAVQEALRIARREFIDRDRASSTTSGYFWRKMKDKADDVLRRIEAPHA